VTVYAVLIPDFPIAALHPTMWLDGGATRPICRSPATRSYKKSFHDALAKSLSVEGMRNPVNVWERDGLFYLRYGQSRVEAATDLGMSKIPAIVSGPVIPAMWFGTLERWIDLQAGPEPFLACFKDPPQQWRIHPDGHLDFYKCLGHFDDELRAAGIWRPSVS